MHLLLCRHGQTDANAQGIVQGHLPTELNALGHRQSELLAKRLFTFHPPITRLITSPLIRAVQTAEPIARLLRLHAIVDDQWSERHFGSGQGQPFHLLRRTTEGPLSHLDPENAEPRDLFDKRIRQALSHLDPHHTTAIITHGGVLGSIIRQILTHKIPTTNPPPERIPIPNCSILHLHRPSPTTTPAEQSAPWTISCLHDASHLEGLTTTLDAG